MKTGIRLLGLITALFLSSASLSGLAQGAGSLPAELDGSMMPYDFSAVDSLPVIPAGYEPVYVSYIARHGARYLSSPKKIEKISKALKEAEGSGNLTKEGMDFLAYISAIEKCTGDKWGLLSSVGIEEEKRLGDEMSRMLPELFRKGRIKTISTFVPRVIMTMYEFNHSLERNHQDLEIYTASGKQNDSLLYFFDAFKQYDAFRSQGDWHKVYDAFLEAQVSPAPAQRLFTGVKKSGHEWRKLTMEMYGIVQGDRAAGFDASGTQWFSEEEYRQCYRASNLVHYLRNTPNPLDPWCAPATAMLIRRITDDADAAVGGGATTGNNNILSGYFGHAETLLPLLAVMNIPGCYYPVSDHDNLDLKWQLQNITPLGANLAFIFLRDPEGEIYVSVRHNGRNVPAYPGAPEVIRWDELKSYWAQRISSFSRPKARLL